MRAFYILSFLICTALFTSCKQDSAAQQETTTSETPNYSQDTINPPMMETSNQNPTSQTTGDQQKSTGTGTAQASTKEGHDYTFLTFKLFKINGAFVPGKDPKEQPYKDQWLDLTPDGKFKWFQGKQLLSSGDWGYNHDLGILDILPSDKKMKPTEWKVIFNDDMVVFTGTSTFENNGHQLQLIRKDQIE